jgi:hypothetical protein
MATYALPVPLPRTARPGGYGLLELLLSRGDVAPPINDSATLNPPASKYAALLPTSTGMLPGSAVPAPGQPVTQVSGKMDTRTQPEETPYGRRDGIAHALFGENPFTNWASDNRSTLQALGAGLLSGPGIDLSGLPRAGQMDDERKVASAEWGKQHKSKRQLIDALTNYGYSDLAEGLAADAIDTKTAWTEMLGRKAADAKTAELVGRNKANAAFIQNPELRAAVEAGALDFAEAFKMDRDPGKFINAGDGNLFNTGSGECISAPGAGGGAPDIKEIFGFEKDLWSQYANSDPVKTFEAVKGGYERVLESAAQSTGAGDMGLIYGYMRMLDPGSVVRESEFAMAAQAGDFGEQVQGMVSRLMNGERLPESQRKEFVANAEKLYGASAGNLEEINSQFTERASEYGVDPNRVIRQPETYPSYGAPPAINNQVEYDALPSGTEYMDPEGNVRRKP